MSSKPIPQAPDADTAIRLCEEAAQLNRDDPFRNGNVLEFPNYGQLVVTGDIHGHTRNLRKIKRYANLELAKVRHVLLHELIHEDDYEVSSPDTSYLVLLEAAAWKVEFPDQIHFLQSNHELSQLTGREIVKFGPPILDAFDDGLRDAYGQRWEQVAAAIDEYIRSLALAARTANRVFVAHSLPSPAAMESFDRTVLDRPIEAADLDGGSAYHLVWGRGHTTGQLDRLADELDADLFVIGHMPIDGGYEATDGRMLVLASNHNHGVLLPIDLSKPATMESLISRIVPLAGVE